MTDPPVQAGGAARRRGWVEAAGVVVACYLLALVAVNVRAAIPWTAHVLPVVGQSIDTTSVDTALRDVANQYVIRSVDTATAASGAEQGLIDELHNKYGDRFSRYLTADDERALKADLSGRRTGSIGIAVDGRCGGKVCAGGQSPDGVIVVEVLHKQPAEAAGIRLGDQLIAVEGTPLTAMGKTLDDQINQASQRIRGTAGTVVHITVRRSGKDVPVTVTRADLSIPSVYAQRFGATLYIQVTGFDTNTGDDAVAQLKQGLAAGATGVVLDLRGNGGGYVTAAQTLASQFVAPIAGKQEDVVLRRGRLLTLPGHDDQTDPQSAQRVDHDPILAGGVALTVPVVLLVDGDTASAAEIVTACLHDYHRATVVGAKTFGKGSVQEDFGLPDGSSLHLTVEKWYGPAGESIDLNGITPDRPVPLASPDLRFRLDSQGPDASADAQLQSALATLARR